MAMDCSIFWRGVTSLLVILALHQVQANGGQAEPVSVSLVGVLESPPNIVVIGDIARVSGGNLITRRKIAALDLVEMDGGSKPRSVSKQQVTVRIVLAGISPTDFRVTGAENVLFRSTDHASTDTTVLEFLRPEIALRLDVDVSHVELRLTRPLPRDLGKSLNGSTRLGHFLPTRIRAGSLSAKIAVYEGDRLIRTAAVPLEIRVSQQVYVANKELESGRTILADDVIQQRRVVTGQIAKHITADVIGKQLRKTVSANSVITTLDIQREATAKRKIVIRSRDLVDVVARKKSMSVKLNGAVALQQGAIGEAIRVKNPQSGKILTARVVDVGIVEIRL